MPCCDHRALSCIRRLAHSLPCEVEIMHIENSINDDVKITYNEIEQASQQLIIDSCLDFIKKCMNFSALTEGRQAHSYIVQNDVIPNTDLEYYIVEMYAQNKHMDDACYTFHQMSHHNVTSWNAIISGFSQIRNVERGFFYFSSMLKEGFQPDEATCMNILKLCAISQSFLDGTQIHIYITKTEQDVSAALGNSLIDMYINCGSMIDAVKVFWGMSEKDIVSWNMLICGCAKGGWYREALEIFWRLISQGKRTNRITLLGAIKAAAGLGCLDIAKQMHDFVKKCGMEPVIYVGSSLIDMYNKCGSPKLGRQVFDKLPERNVVVWTSMIGAYVQHEHHEEALKLFKCMEREDVSPNEVTFITILKACSSASTLPSGKEIHAFIRRREMQSSAVVQASLVDMYSKCGSLVDALCVCEQMHAQGTVQWNCMIAGCVAYGHHEDSLTLVFEMEQRGIETNEITFIPIVKSCTHLHAVELGKQVHLRIIEKKVHENRVLSNLLVDFYYKCGDIDGAFGVFDYLAHRDVVSWNIVMAGYAVREDMEEILLLYRQMQQEAVQPDGVTYLSMFLSCGSLGALEIGEQFHACVNGGFEEPAMPIINTLIDMYAKCGSIEKAVGVFESVPTRRQLVSWNIMLTGCSQHGCGKDALRLFEQMQEEGVRFDAISLIAVVSACSYAGLVANGCFCYTLMTEAYGVLPSEEGFACVVDMFGRAGQLEAAKVCMVEMGGAVYAEVWKALLAACRIHYDWMLAKFAADRVLALEPLDSGAFVLWSNICAENADS